MAYRIDPTKVAGVVVEANQVLTGKGFNQAEVIIGLSELVGRVIVETADTHIQMNELLKVVVEHLNRTITAGNQAREKNFGVDTSL